MIVIATGGLRIIHWEENRHNPPDNIWKGFGHINIGLLPVDEFQLIVLQVHMQMIIDRQKPRVIILHHSHI